MTTPTSYLLPPTSSVAPISVCMIVRNEKAYLRQCLSKIRPHVAEICIVDTGSDDETPDIARDFADKFEVFTDCNDEQGRILNFSLARNHSFSLATQPWVMWLDGDDEFVGGEHLNTVLQAHYSLYQRAKDKGYNISIKMMAPYNHHNRNDELELSYMRERFFLGKDNFKWVAPVHEVVVPKSWQGLLDMPAPPEIKVIHRKRESGKASGEPHRNIRILEAHKAKGELEPRMLFYLGREYSECGQLLKAEKVLSEYVEKSHFEAEKANALIRLADIAIGKGDHKKALHWGFQLLALKESMQESYFLISKVFFIIASMDNNIRNWQKCVKFAELGFQQSPEDKPLFLDPNRRGIEIAIYYSRALGYVGRNEDGLKITEKYLESYPLDRVLLNHKKYYVEKLGIQEFKNSGIQAVETNKDADQLLEAANGSHLKNVDEQVRSGDVSKEAKCGSRQAEGSRHAEGSECL